MKALSNDKFYLELIPILLDKQNNVCLPGQAFKTDLCKLFIYSAVSYDGKAWYTDVQGEDPLSEYDVYNDGRLDAIIGYGRGLHYVDFITGTVKYMTITVKEYIRIRSKAKKVDFLVDIMPNVFAKSNDGVQMHTETGIQNLKPINFGILMDEQKLREWNSNFSKSKYLQVLKNKYVGIKGSPKDLRITLTEILNQDNLFLPMQMYKWNHKNPWGVIDEKVRMWCYQDN